MVKTLTGKIFAVLVICSAIAAPFSTVLAAPGKVEKITVKIVDVTGQADQTVLERMAVSMQAVAQQILLGKTLDTLEAGAQMYQTVLHDISERVFAGYSTENVFWHPGRETLVTIEVQPWAATVKDVKIELYFSGVDAQWQKLVEEQLPGIREKVRQILSGVSVDSVDWAATLVKDYVRDEVAKNLPSFKATVDVAGGETLIVDIVLIPIGSIIQGVKFELHSDTMPSMVLLDARKRLLDQATQIRGLPVDFVAINRQKIESSIKTEVEKERIVKNYKLLASVDVEPKVDSDVTIALDSDKYRLWIEGYVDIGRDNSALSGRLHAGKLIARKDEIFLEVSLFTDDVKWKFDPGISRRWGNTKLSFLYRVPDDEGILRLEYDFAKAWRLRVEKYGHIARPEFALRYRIHEFLAAEFVLGADRENYLRVVGNL